MVQLAHLEDGSNIGQLVIIVFCASKKDDSVIVTHVCLCFVIYGLLSVLV